MVARGAQRSATAGEPDAGGRRLVGSLLHGLSILEMFDRDRRTVGIGEMAAHLGLHKSSASRLAATLAAAGFLVADRAPGEYRLGHRLAAIGRLAADDADLQRTVLPHLRRLTELSGETGHLAVLDGSWARTVAITDGWHTVRMHSWVGKTAPAYGSSMGKALLAGLDPAVVRTLYDGDLETFTGNTVRTADELPGVLDELRRRGYGYDDEELEVGLRCVSAPIVGRDGEVSASISVSGPSQRLVPDRIPALAEHVRWAAARASEQLGGPPTPPGWAPAPAAEPPPLPWIHPPP